jgi:hypothetical protein
MSDAAATAVDGCRDRAWPSRERLVPDSENDARPRQVARIDEHVGAGNRGCWQNDGKRTCDHDYECSAAPGDTRTVQASCQRPPMPGCFELRGGDPPAPLAFRGHGAYAPPRPEKWGRAVQPAAPVAPKGLASMRAQRYNPRPMNRPPEKAAVVAASSRCRSSNRREPPWPLMFIPARMR